MMQRVAIAGFGAIGKVVAEALDAASTGCSRRGVGARRAARRAGAGRFRPSGAGVAARPPLGEADIVVECAPAALLREIAEPALAAGRTLIVR